MQTLLLVFVTAIAFSAFAYSLGYVHGRDIERRRRIMRQLYHSGTRSHRIEW